MLPPRDPLGPLWKALWFWMVVGLLVGLSVVNQVNLRLPSVTTTYL